MAHHELKIWPSNFEEVKSGRTPFDIRMNDRRFQKGDTITYKEWDPNRPPVDESVAEQYRSPGDFRFTGRTFARTISCVISGWGIQPDYVVFGLAPGGPA